MRVRLWFVLMFVCAAAAPAAAQGPDRVPAAAAIGPASGSVVPAQAAGGLNVGVRVYGLYETVSLSASESFDAVFGDSRASGPGFGVEVTRLWRGVFARLALSRQSKDGGIRVNIIEATGEVVPNGVATEVSMTPLEFGLGWRQPLDVADRYVGYAGFSALRMKFTQTSEFANTNDDVDENFNGYAIFAGIDAEVTRGIFVGAEFQLRRVPDAIGFDDDPTLPKPVAAFYDEHDLGGAVFRVLFGVRR